MALRVAIAGSGSIGKIHARSARLAGAELVAVAASTPESAQAAAAALGAERAFDSAEEMRSHVDLVATSVGRTGADAARLLKHVVRHGAQSSLEDQLKLESITNGLCLQSSEFLQSKARFLKSMQGRTT